MPRIIHTLIFATLATLISSPSTARNRPRHAPAPAPAPSPAESSQSSESIVSPEFKASSQLSDFNVPVARVRQHPGFVALSIDVVPPRPVKLLYRFDSFMADVGAGFDFSPQEVVYWRDACQDQCDSWLYRKAAYKLTGDGLTDENVTFPKLGRKFLLTVHPRSMVLRGFGWASLWLGAIATIAGFAGLGAFIIGQGTVSRDIALAGHFIGIPLMLVSIPMFKFSRTVTSLERLD